MQGEFDIWNHEPRKIVCANSEPIPMIGYGDDKHELEVDKVYELEAHTVYSCYTLVKVKGIKTVFNSVLFGEMDGYKYVTDSEEMRRWGGCPIVQDDEDDEPQQEESMNNEDVPHVYKKKPVEIMAIKWTGKNFDAVKEFAGEDVALDGDELIIKTLEDGSKGQAKHVATVGDFVIRGVAGEFYFCKPQIFKDTYELAEK